MRQGTLPIASLAEDTEPRSIPEEEEQLLVRVKQALARGAGERGRHAERSDDDLLALRDEIAEARMEDVPALVAQMERLQQVAARRAEAQGALVDPSAPYFGHMRLRETAEERGGRKRERERDVLIGRATYVDAESGVRVVDWRHAPVSQLYYRYSEGSTYEERFGDTDVEGEVLVRRTLTIQEGELLRVSSPESGFVRDRNGVWVALEVREYALAGGQGTATRPADVGRGVLGAGEGAHQRLDRHMPEIAALIDPRQFELISAPSAGLVVVHGGAGSGKTTIGLHRMAYLAYAEPKRFTPDRMLVVTHGPGLAAYIGQVLPSLGVGGVDVVTFSAWAHRERRRAFPWFDPNIADDTPSAVTRFKKHPALLHELERRAKELLAREGSRRDARVVLELWAETLTDLPALLQAFAADGAGATGAASDVMGPSEIKRAHRWCADRCPAVLEHAASRQGEDEEGVARPDDDDVRGDFGIDGIRTEDERATLDVEDDALLLRLTQLVRGPLRRKKTPLLFSHLFVDEAQDLSPIELAVLLGQTTTEKSVTLAGDTAQRLFLDNGFSDWRSTLRHLSLEHVAIEPLRIAYRSTREILGVARYALGPLAEADPPSVPRSGAPVEAHAFPDPGAAVAFLGEALRTLFVREPRATVAVIARHPEQADVYEEGLRRSEVPHLRRVRVQDFAFRPGVDVTDVRQVKGLEFDYVILVDANATTYPADDESRHLFHIAATRAAHQLWIIVTNAAPTPLVPPELIVF